MVRQVVGIDVRRHQRWSLRKECDAEDAGLIRPRRLVQASDGEHGVATAQGPCDGGVLSASLGGVGTDGGDELGFGSQEREGRSEWHCTDRVTCRKQIEELIAHDLLIRLPDLGAPGEFYRGRVDVTIGELEVKFVVLRLQRPQVLGVRLVSNDIVVTFV